MSEVSKSAYPTPGGFGPLSTAPVAFDLGDEWDVDAPSFRPKKRRGLVAVMAVAVLGGGGFALTRFDVSALGSVVGGSAAAGNAVQAAALAPAPPPPVAPAPAPQAAAAPATQAPSTTTLSLTEEQKRALADADNKRAAVSAAKHKTKSSGGGGASKSAPVHSAPVFHKGGSPHDPLNSSL